MEKDFPGWHQLKAQLHAQPDVSVFQEREIWWCCVGVNIGFEADGKHEYFNRPVLVVRKFNKRFFFGIPLTTQRKPDNPYYFPLHFHGRENCALLSQARPFDAKRLTHKMGRLPKNTFNQVKKALADMIDPACRN